MLNFISIRRSPDSSLMQ